MSVKISIVIPCYNQGHFIQEALDSIYLNNRTDLYEIIIVNDGSTDANTINVLNKLSENGMNVIFQENKGLSAARNAGILQAKGEYILPLDADNKIRPDYINKSIEILDARKEVAVVYGDAQNFGEKNDRWVVGEFNLQRLMIANFIDACAVIRKPVLLDVGMYDEKGIGGLEDWDLWLRIAFSRGEFVYVPEVLFDYRVATSSMSGQFVKNYSRRNYYIDYVESKYPSLLGAEWILDYAKKRFKGGPLKFIIKLVLISYFPKYYKKLLKKNKIISGL